MRNFIYQALPAHVTFGSGIIASLADAVAALGGKAKADHIEAFKRGTEISVPLHGNSGLIHNSSKWGGKF
ncbi:hypothetical protein BH09PSE3_BH09PSE3_07380 [soil metagenome]